MPEDASGVRVVLTAKDPNGNTEDIGETTSDICGNFGIKWEPTMEGTYQVTATFEGSKSYGSSFDTTYVAVGPVSPAGPIEPEEPEAFALSITEIAIIAAVAVAVVVGIVAYWVLRRR
jgi:hypothetical protein